MQNAECKMQNVGAFQPALEIIGIAEMIILHSSFYILHFIIKKGCIFCSPFDY